jgi:hypothetical protein
VLLLGINCGGPVRSDCTTPAVFLGAFEKVRKATISFVMSVRLFVCQSVGMEQLGSYWMDFDEI